MYNCGIQCQQCHLVMILTFYLVLYQKGILNVQNQPYDEALEIPDGEEVASEYSPTPRVHPGNCSESFVKIM